jgi:hypothetical protein
VAMFEGTMKCFFESYFPNNISSEKVSAKY